MTTYVSLFIHDYLLPYLEQDFMKHLFSSSFSLSLANSVIIYLNIIVCTHPYSKVDSLVPEPKTVITMKT